MRKKGGVRLNFSQRREVGAVGGWEGAEGGGKKGIPRGGIGPCNTS